jgi:hypothetical protein
MPRTPNSTSAKTCPTDKLNVRNSAQRVARQAQAQAFAADIRQRAAGLVAVDREISANLLAATEGLGTVSFDDAPIPGSDGTPPHKTERNGVQLVDNHFPLPERPRTDPEPPPGGWSHDPLTRAAQKIARGHSWDKHSGEFRGMTQDQLTNAIKDMLRRNSQDPASLIIERTPDGAPALYDPKKDIIVIRDPKALDAGTVFKPDVPDLENIWGRRCRRESPQYLPVSLPIYPPRQLHHRAGHRRHPHPDRPPLLPSRLRLRRYVVEVYPSFLSDPDLPHILRPPDHTLSTGRNTIVCNRRCWAKRLMKSRSMKVPRLTRVRDIRVVFLGA